MSFFAPITKQFSKGTAKALTPARRDDIDDFLSSDLENSFASSMSLNSPTDNSPNFSQQHARPRVAHSPMPMDISPMPPAHQVPPKAATGRNRGLTVRGFGRDVANSPGLSPLPLLPVDATRSVSRGRQRSALPSHWMADADPKARLSGGTLIDGAVTPGGAHCSFESDAMDVDSPAYGLSRSAPSSPTVHQAITIAMPPVQDTFAELFENSASPAVPLVSKKRRSISPDPTVLDVQSSSPPASSPTARKFERFASTGHTAGPLFKKPSLMLGTAAGGTVANPAKRRRPILSAIVVPTEVEPAQSAYPIIDSAKASKPLPPAPVRRAFSALVPPTFGVEASSDDTSGELDGSSPAGAYARRQEARVIRKVDGTHDFRPLHGAGALNQRDREQVRGNAGMPEFGDCESVGKLLPCHKVKEDGLMRVTGETVNALLDGRFAKTVQRFKIIDCRFQYEFAGGHIPGAINIHDTQAIESLLAADRLPVPSKSGDPTPKEVLIFHCELSEKRAPTLAKHLRSKDRALVGKDLYPRVHFPELYILHGGYKAYYKTHPERCIAGYVGMDDPAHAPACEKDLDRFRKWQRTRSYTYGDRAAPVQPARAPQRNSAPVTAFAPVVRRSADLVTVAEDTSHSGSDDPHVDDSPCPPPARARPRALERAATHGPGRLY